MGKSRNSGINIGNPTAGRFISQDKVTYLDPETINGLNLYAYCGNNPVTRVDN